MTTNAPAIDAMIHGRRADSTRRRQRVLTALDNAIKDGAELSVSNIARRAGVTRGALYHHFEGKRELFQAVYEDVEQALVGGLPEHPPERDLRQAAEEPAGHPARCRRAARDLRSPGRAGR